jgi:hypothetical protein
MQFAGCDKFVPANAGTPFTDMIWNQFCSVTVSIGGKTPLESIFKNRYKPLLWYFAGRYACVVYQE